MKRFEAPFTNLSHEDRLNGLCLQAIDIAESVDLQQGINDFMMVAADKPSFTAEGHTFNSRRISTLGSRGTLLSVYMQQPPHRTLPFEQSYVLLSATTQNPIVEAWATTLVPQEYGSKTTELVIGELEEESHLSSIDLALSQEQMEEEALRDRLWREREWQGFPRVRFGGDAWQYEQDGAAETLNDLAWVSDRVRLAIRRGFGEAAFKRFDPDTYFTPEAHQSVDGTGQKEEKMVA